MESDDLAEKCRRDEEIRRKREIYEQSNGKDASAEWRSKRKREGRIWVLEEESNQS